MNRKIKSTIIFSSLFLVSIPVVLASCTNENKNPSTKSAPKKIITWRKHKDNWSYSS
ncbi:hypothetical protein [Ureaplasma diversum]|uniref:hypothetical protein n=1 Tax=Ureaplasma diversum TaxID=42094 RepID=UPI0012DE9349|nr:hypothetical protein [Ureaplasma diversum]